MGTNPTSTILCGTDLGRYKWYQIRLQLCLHQFDGRSDILDIMHESILVIVTSLWEEVMEFTPSPR